MNVKLPGWVLALVAGLLVGLGVGIALHHLPAPGPVPTPTPTPVPKPDWFGWRGADERSKAIAATLPKLSQAAPHLMRPRDPGDQRPILLYRAWTDLFRDVPPYPAQQIGDCVSFGHGHALDLLQCVEWVLSHGPRGPPPQPVDIQESDTEFIYAASREVAGILGGGDGSYGSAAVKALTTVGALSRRQLGADGTYSGRRAKAWGRTGPPSELKTRAAAYKLGSAAQVSTWDELVAALASGHPVTICSNQGFGLQRDAEGFCQARGSWAHCMFIAGVRFDRPGACIVQSWGPESPSGPRALDQPSYSFWADRNVIERILRAGDSWALSKAPRFGGEARSRRALPESWRRAA